MDIPERTPRICFVAHNAYGALAAKDTGHIGGIERQQAFMARWLAERGYPVCMLTWDEGHPDGAPIDGVRVFNVCPRNAGPRGVRFFHPHWSGLIRALARADAQVYYQNCGECVTGQVALWCRRHGRKFIYSVASDPDVDPALPEMKTLRERILYRYGLTRAHHVIAQTRSQHRALWDCWGIQATLIPMPCVSPAPAEAVPDPSDRLRAPRVLWIGRMDANKRLDWFLEIARSCPDLRFDVVGRAAVGDRSFGPEVAPAPNAVLHGYQPPEELGRFYRAAAVLCCTSRFEGFPNTFLEAWSHGVPVVSTVDPDGLIATQGLGAVAGDVTGLIGRIRGLLASPAAWMGASANAQAYYRNNHRPEVVMPRFENIFQEVVHE